MEQVPIEMREEFERRLEGARIPELQRPGYRKWLRFYIDFCHKYGHSPTSASSLGPFLSKLASKKQSVGLQVHRRIRQRLGAPLEGPGVSGVSASAPGRGSSWEREYRDLEGAIRLRNYSGKTLEAYRGEEISGLCA